MYAMVLAVTGVIAVLHVDNNIAKIIGMIAWNICSMIAIHNYDNLLKRVKKLEDKEKQNDTDRLKS